METALLEYTTSGYGYSASASRKFGSGKFWNVVASGQKIKYDQVNTAANLAQTYSTSFSIQNYGMSGSFSKDEWRYDPNVHRPGVGTATDSRGRRTLPQGRRVFCECICESDAWNAGFSQLCALIERHLRKFHRVAECKRPAHHPVPAQVSSTLVAGWLFQAEPGNQRFWRAAGQDWIVLYRCFTVVQLLLRTFRFGKIWTMAVVCLLAVAPLAAAGGGGGKDSKTRAVTVPELQLEGGRKLDFERSFWSEPEVKLKRGFWSKLVDMVAGGADFHALISPYEVAEDSHGRMIVTDPGCGRSSHF